MQTSAVLGALLALNLSSSAWPSRVLGQWAVAVEVGSDRFWGGSVENTAEHRSFRPYRPTTLGAGLERQAGKLGVALCLRYTEASLALEGEEALVAIKGIFSVFSVSPEVSYRIATVGSGNQLLLHGGPLFEVWTIIDEDSKTRVGIQSAVSLSVPLGDRFAGSVMVGAALTASPFTKEQLDENFEPRALWRRSVAARLAYRL